MLKSFDYKTLIIFTVMMGLAPFFPMPHLVEKIIMLKNGTLSRPIDIFDLVFHSAPAILLAIKFISDKKKGA